MSSQMYRLPEQAAREEGAEMPRLRYITATEYSTEWNSTPHTHACSELFFVTGGHGVFHIRDREFPTAVNDVVVVNANVPHTEESQTENPLSYVVLGIDRLEAMADIGGSTMIHLQGQQPRLNFCLELMLQEAREQAEGWDAVCQSMMEILLRRLSRREDFSLADSGSENKVNRECELVRRYIDNHFKENLRLDELAKLAHINKYYLSHAFRKEFGTSPISYLISRRIQESRFLLADTDHSLSQIAHILGFSSLSYFSQSFHRLEGISPMEFRRRCRNRSAGQGGRA